MLRGEGEDVVNDAIQDAACSDVDGPGASSDVIDIFAAEKTMTTPIQTRIAR
jgi:hypothetical protein